MTQTSTQPTDRAARRDPLAWVTRVAFYGVLALIVTRATVLQTVREPLGGVGGAPDGPGAGAGLWLDWLCLIPAVLVLTRRAIDRTYVLRNTLGLWVWLLLAVWVAISVAWASDRFAAAIESSRWVAATGLLWATSQLVRSGLRVRIVAGVAAGLLAIFVTHATFHRYVEHPETVRYWQENRHAFFAEQGWTPDSFAARQFERRVLAGEAFGFTASPNTFAAILVVVMTVTGGLAVQRWRDGDEWGWPAAAGTLVATGLLPLIWTGGRSAVIVSVLAAGGLAWQARRSRWSRQTRPSTDAGASRARHAWAFGGTLGGLTVVAGLVTTVGLLTGGLIDRSLTFRWHYWTGAAGILASHPLLGVGWANFADAYLAHRPLVAVEEVRDPHNLFVRSFAELGIVGGILILLAVIRTAWEVTRPRATAAEPSPAEGLRTTTTSTAEWGWIAGMLVGATALTLAVSVDWSQPAGFWGFEVLRRGLYAILLALGVALTTVRASDDSRPDGREAGLVTPAILTALTALLLLNQVDFSLSEPGTLFVAALLLGTVWGVRMPSVAGRHARTAASAGVLAGVAVALLTMLFGFVLPTAEAERRAREAGRIDARDADAARARAAAYVAAYESAPFPDARWMSLAGASLANTEANPALVQAYFAQAAGTDPRSPGHRLDLARWLRRQPPTTRDAERVVLHYREAIARNPTDADLRVEFAETLLELGRPAEASGQARTALQRDDALPVDEPRRLPENRRATAEQVAHPPTSPAHGPSDPGAVTLPDR